MCRHRFTLPFLLIVAVAGGAAEVQHVFVMDACPAVPSICDRLPDTFRIDGVYHFENGAEDPNQVWCDMSGGRWNVIMRRGVDGDNAAVAATDQLDFRDQDPATFDTLFGDIEGEFWAGITSDWNSFDMMVDLETNDQTRYFSIFKPSSHDSTGLTVGPYAYGTGGDGGTQKLNTAPFNTDCNPAWFSADCSDVDEPSRPHLTLPLDDAAGARWPSINKPITKIGLKFRPSHVNYCTGQLVFSPSLLDRADVDLPSGLNSIGWGGLSNTARISCKDTTKIIPSKRQQEAGDLSTVTSEITMTCEANNRLSDHPLSDDATCMDNCDQNYVLVAPTVWTLSATLSYTVDRTTCVSQVHNEVGLGLYEAAKKCGDRGEQLLDFPLPADKLVNLDETGIITAMHFGASLGTTEITAFDLRGNNLEYPMADDVSDGETSGRCVGLLLKAGGINGVEIKPVNCFDPNLRYACHKSPGCGEGQFFWEGFCYQYMPPVPMADHMSTCWQPPFDVGRLSGMPAATSDLDQSVFQENRASITEFVVGVYKRQDGFFRGRDLLPADQFGPPVADDGECAVFDVASDQLSVVACDSTDPYPLLCQFPGLPPNECFQRSDYVGTETADSTRDPSSVGRRANYSCPWGKNFAARSGPHTLEYECQGLRGDWKLLTSLDAAATSDRTYVSPRPECVVACDMEDMSTAAAGSNISVKGIDRYSGCPDGLMMSNSRSEGFQRCFHETQLLAPPTLPPCDHCVEQPFAPDEDFTAVRLWDGSPVALGGKVQFACREGFVTPAGDDIQNQTCALPAWEGEVVECSTCVWPPEFDHPLMSVNKSEPGFGQLVEMECSAGLQAADNSTRSSAVCTPDGWERCHDSFNCSYCSGEPSNLTTLLFMDGNWDGESRYMGFTVNYTCQENMTTPDGDTEQVQNCTEKGWSGSLMSCSECQGTPLELDMPGITREWNGNTTVGHDVIYRCNEGLSTAGGLTEQVQYCLFGWQGDILPCDSCVGNPPDISGMDTVSHNWTNSRSLGTSVTYTCTQGLVTSTGQREQLVTCGLAGWEGELLPCDSCEAPQEANHTSISGMDVTLLGAGKLGSSLDYRCQPGLSTEDGQDHIRSICLPGGWDRCEGQIQCNYCSPLPELITWGGTLSWDYNGTNVLGSTVTLTCEPGLATQDLATEQTLVCAPGGWNHTAAQSCSVCRETPPPPLHNMQPNATWALGDLTATYTCLEQKILPWQQATYELTCSPTGWNCVPECDWCVAPPSPPPGSYNSNYFGNPGGTAVYTCVPSRATVDQRTSQELTCGETHWEGVLQPCDSCLGSLAEPSLSQNRTWSGNNTLFEVANYDCYEGMETRNGFTNQSQSCLEDGWTEPPEPCDLCVQPPAVTFGMERDWDGNRTVNSSLTYTCEGNMTTMSNISVQVLNCTENGWWPPLETCAECRMDIPYAGNGSEARNVSWDGGRYPRSTVQYTCQNGLVQTVICRDGAWHPPELPECRSIF